MFGFKYSVVILSIGLVNIALAQVDPVVVGLTFLAGSTDPSEGSTPWALTSHGVAEKLFTVTKHDEIVGQVANSATKTSDLVWEVALKPDYKFSDGTPVTAEAVASCLMNQNTNNSGAQSSLGKMTVTAVNDLTVRIESERVTHVMDAVLAEWVFVVHYQDTNGNFVFTGPFVISEITPDEIKLLPNEYYPGSSERPNVNVKKFRDGHELADAVENKQVDIAFHLPIDRLPDLRRVDDISIKSFEVGYHFMMFYNLDTLEDVRVRKAIDLAIDRQALSQALAGGTGTRSLFPDFSPFFADDSDVHGDHIAAETLLDEAGWTLNSNGKRFNQNGELLTVNLVAYPQRPGLVIMQPVIAESLTDLGITVNTIVTGQDWPETQQIIDERSFDLIMWAQHTLPAGDPLWFLSTFFRSDGGSNHANLNSANVDSHIDMLANAEGQERVLLAQAAQEAVLQEVPVSNLVTPYWHVALSERVASYEPWGSDYYIIRADLSVVSPEESSAGHNSKIRQGMMMTSLIVWVVAVAVW